MKTSSPKEKILQLLKLAYPGATLEVRGTRIKGRDGSARDYLTEASVNDTVVARARHRDWRKSYTTLKVEVSKLTIA